MDIHTLETLPKDVLMYLALEFNIIDIINLCKSSKKINDKICKQKHFWSNKFINEFGKESVKYKPVNETWQRFYINVVSSLDKVSSDPWEFFDNIYYSIANMGDDEPKIIMSGELVNPRNGPNDKKYPYYLLNLGNKISLQYMLDRYGELQPVIKHYQTDTYFTPEKVMKLIKDFYKEKVSREEFELQVETMNPYAEDYTIDDLGTIERRDLFPMFFEGITKIGNIGRINFGS